MELKSGAGWFDTHAHLSDAKFDSDRAETIDRAYQNGVSGIVEIADGPAEWLKAKTLARQYPTRMWWAGGLHPYHADLSSDTTWSELKNLAVRDDQFVAIGEIGLDYAKCPIPPDVQIAAFRRGMDLALELDKPVIIHCREAYDDLLPVLRDYAPALQRRQPHPPGVVHCFSGDESNARELIGWGFYLGIDGPLTYPSAKSLRQIMESIPTEHLVIETDSPYLPPQTHRGQRNEPQHIGAVGTALAVLKGAQSYLLSDQLLVNSQRLYRLK
jgi:TatD DNase family protein